ncbi:MAG: phosphoribosylformylglycinamidine synthase I [Planctomycetes bacterium]|nr:phosphoribosylformylglycinamidine synthase I [Planctomycetota bacterium]
MVTPKTLVLRTAGTNCDLETLHAFTLAGSDVQSLHVNRLIQNPKLLHNYQILAIPGGFSYGDDIAAGKILANQFIHHLADDLHKFIDSQKLILGICNGFQVLVKAKLLPQPSSPTDNSSNHTQKVTITHNDSGKFEDRWVYLDPATDTCPFITPGQRLYLPIAHAEGKLCFADEQTLQETKSNNQIAFRYVDQDGNPGGYPINPNGSTDHIAGLCDPTGRILGLMPHPERFLHPTNHPRWTRQKINTPDGLTIFKNAINFFTK